MLADCKTEISQSRQYSGAVVQSAVLKHEIYFVTTLTPHPAPVRLSLNIKFLKQVPGQETLYQVSMETSAA